MSEGSQLYLLDVIMSDEHKIQSLPQFLTECPDREQSVIFCGLDVGQSVG